MHDLDKQQPISLRICAINTDDHINIANKSMLKMRVDLALQVTALHTFSIFLVIAITRFEILLHGWHRYLVDQLLEACISMETTRPILSFLNPMQFFVRRWMTCSMHWTGPWRQAALHLIVMTWRCFFYIKQS